MDDIRDIERKTAEELKKKMRGEDEDSEVKKHNLEHTEDG